MTDDIYSLLAIVNLQPLAEKETFQYAITDPIMQRKRCGLTRLRTAMAYVALRRTKRVANIKLVSKEVQIRNIDWVDGLHKQVYDAIFSSSQAAVTPIFKSVEEAGDNGESVIAKSLITKATFEMLLRARQACCHGQLVPVDRLQRSEWAMAEIEANEGREMTVAQSRIIIENLLGDGEAGILEAPSLAAEPMGHSPKILALLDAIGEMKPDEKGIVFSQWTSFLNIIEQAVVDHGIKVVRIDGAKTTEQRIAAMDEFKNNDEVRLILCSLQAAGTGINLTRGNVIFMMDVWWNEAAENQAMDRCHRVGQERNVRCIRFVMKDSIEERMIRMQQAKAALGKGALERISREEESLAHIATLKEFFQIGDCSTDADVVDWQY